MGRGLALGSLPLYFVAVAVALAVAVPQAAALPEAARVEPAPASCRSIPADADAPLRADLARADFGVDGTGVTVGIISDSMNVASATGSTLDDDVAAGLLPGPGNPCGYTRPVEIMAEWVGPEATDEGRGMAQAVHGIAPGATMVFHTVDDEDPATVAGAITALADAGADIIVDDASPYNETYLQQSLAGSAIEDAVARGVVYVSAVGNDTLLSREPRPGQWPTPIGAWQTNAYRPTACPDGIVDAARNDGVQGELDCMDFDQTAGIDTTLGFTARLTYDDAGWVFQWGEPAGGFRADFIPIALVDGVPTGTRTPLPGGVPGYRLILPTGVDRADLQMAIVRVTDPADPATSHTPALTLQTNSDENWLYSAEYWRSSGADVVGATAVGHNTAAAAISVAAANYQTPFVPEDFSTVGPTRLYLTPQTTDGAADLLPEPLVIGKPDVMGIDGIRNSVLGDAVPGEPGVVTFSGTSAAAPSIAAVIALVLQANPAMTPDAARDLLTTTARPVASPYEGIPARDVVGAGLVDAHAMMSAAEARRDPVVPDPDPDPELARTGPGLVAALGGSALALLLAGAALAIRRGHRREPPQTP